MASPGAASEPAGNSHWPWPVPAIAFSIVAGVALSTWGDAGTGAVLGGLKFAAVAVAGVNVSDPPVPAAEVEPSTVGGLAATVTL